MRLRALVKSITTGSSASILVLSLAIVLIILFCLNTQTLISYQNNQVEQNYNYYGEKLLASDLQVKKSDSISERVDILQRQCLKYKDPFRSEHLSLFGNVNRLGVEVVYLKSGPLFKMPMISVCIPHKVGSHAWGQFSRLPDLVVDQTNLDLSWKIKAELSLKAVVVRHPLERLVSVYRMIFQDWCDEKRFLAQQWNNVCVTDFDEKSAQNGYLNEAETETANSNTRNKSFSTFQFLFSMADQQRHGNDRYIKKIWQKFNPSRKLVDPKSQLKFNFQEFVRFVLNASSEFGDDVLNHQGLKYHWAPFWQECSVCSNLTQPDVILRMESLQEDLKYLLSKAGYRPSDVSKLVEKFPHTHSQAGGHSQYLSLEFYSTLTREEVKNLIDFYRLDHELFGYDSSPYLNVAKSQDLEK